MRLCKPFTCGARPVNRHNTLMRQRAGRQAGERSSVTQAAAQAGGKSVIAKWAKAAGLRSSVVLEDFLGDRLLPLSLCLFTWRACAKGAVMLLLVSNKYEVSTLCALFGSACVPSALTAFTQVHWI